VQGKQDAASSDFQDGFPSGAVKFAHHGKYRSQYDDAGNHSVPHEGQSAQGNQSAEDAGPSGQKYGDVQYH
jgi:hypothetical protein